MTHGTQPGHAASGTLTAPAAPGPPRAGPCPPRGRGPTATPPRGPRRGGRPAGGSSPPTARGRSPRWPAPKW